MKREVEAYRRSLQGKRIMVVGMGRSGKASVKALHELKACVDAQDIHTVDRIDPKFVTYLEREEIEYYFGTEPAHMDGYDMVVLSPGVSPTLGFLEAARAAGVEVIGELELAYRLTHGRYVAVTGTNGKTTTTTLLGQIFEEAGKHSAVIGNIGIAAISEAAASREDEWLITEASSFQLETTTSFCPVVALILNLTPDHLNRHKTMDAYGQAKAAVTRNQSEADYLIINKDDPDCFALAAGTRAQIIPFSRRERLSPGAFLDGDRIVLCDVRGTTHEICGTEELKVIGDHNVENVLAASAAAFFAGIEVASIAAAVRAFPGVEHRIEYCGTVDGVRFYNDSKGTNVDAAVIALQALKENTLLIAGGDGKAQEFTALAEQLAGRVKHLILMGRDAQVIETAAREAGFTAISREKDMNACVQRAVELAEEGDKVLLSPACASWDMYDNYEQRGDHFKECVRLRLK